MRTYVFEKNVPFFKGARLFLDLKVSYSNRVLHLVQTFGVSYGAMGKIFFKGPVQQDF